MSRERKISNDGTKSLNDERKRDLYMYSSIPKKIAGHMLFLSAQDVQRPALKVGQTIEDLRTRDIYSKIADTRSEKYSILNHGNTFIYKKTEFQDEFDGHTTDKITRHSKNIEIPQSDPIKFEDITKIEKLIHEIETKPSNGYHIKNCKERTEQYKDKCFSSSLYPLRDYNQNIKKKESYLPKYIDRNTIQIPQETKIATENWKSIMHTNYTPMELNPSKKNTTLYTLQNKTEKSKNVLTAHTCYQIDYKENPNTLIKDTDTQIPKKYDDELLKGTTKISSHPAGFSCYLPKELGSNKLKEYGYGIHTRSLDKTPIFDIYSHNVPYYNGYRFLAAKNDYGPRKPSVLSTAQSALMEPYSLKIN